jgi:hypothetical protein
MMIVHAVIMMFGLCYTKIRPLKSVILMTLSKQGERFRIRDSSLLEL